MWSSVVKKLNTNLEKFETRDSCGPAYFLLKHTAISNLPRAMDLLSSIWPSMKLQHQIYDNITRIYHEVGKLAGTMVVCDSSHRITQAMVLSHRHQVKMKIIHLVRDGRGVINSIRKRKNTSVARATIDWKKANEVTLKNHRRLPDNHLLRVRYENMCDNPAQEIEKICRFLGVGYRDVDLTRLHEIHFIGGSSTIRNTDFQNFSINKDESWKKELSEHDKAAFNRIAGRLNDLYGYEN